MYKDFDVIIVGAGPAGLFCAHEMITKRPNAKIVIIEKGKPIEMRHCPAAEVGRCIKCDVCDVTQGCAGAGAHADGKLLEPKPSDRFVRGNLGKHMTLEESRELFTYTDRIYLSYGANPMVYGKNAEGFMKDLQPFLNEAGLRAKTSLIRHLGTDGSRKVYKKIQDFLMEKGVTFLFNTEVTDIICNEGSIKGVQIQDVQFNADCVVLAVGRAGTAWLESICKKYGIEYSYGSADIGVRYELPNSVMADINEHLYEGKFIGTPYPFQDKVRTFCQNPYGLSSEEGYPDGLTLVNGHSYLVPMSDNTNLALLVSLNLSGLSNPNQVCEEIARLVNLIGDGQPVVQRLDDLRSGKATTYDVLARNTVKPTLTTAVPGDLTIGLPYRIIMAILGFIKQMNIVAPGFADGDNLLYAPEAKFYSLNLNLTKYCETTIKGLYGIGDGSGPTHGLMPASVNGVFLARHLLEKLF